MVVVEGSLNAAEDSIDPVAGLGLRLRSVRMESGLSLRELARQLGVSPSFVSQLENGKSQPSVATLYSLSQLLGVSIDDLFASPAVGLPAGVDGPLVASAEVVDPVHDRVSRSSMGSPADAWNASEELRICITSPGERPRLEMDSGVVWEQLAPSPGRTIDFIEIEYPPGSSSTNDSRMLRHPGREFGYLMSGALDITFGFETFRLEAHQAMSLDSSVPHLLTNSGDVPARGVWAVFHQGDSGIA